MTPAPHDRASAGHGPLSAGGRALGAGGRILSEEQTRAIERRRGPLLLVAGAGSGKTTVLVERFVRHVLLDGVAVGGILAITFTRKAAGELRSRIRERFVELGCPDFARESEGAWISTIDGFCARVLRAHAISAGLDPEFTVLDDSGRRAAREEAFGRALDAWLAPSAAEPRLDAAQLLAGYGHDALAAAIWQVYDRGRSAGHRTPAIAVPERPDPSHERRELLTAVAAAQADLAAEPSAKMVDAARAKLDACAAVLADGADPLDARAAGKAWSFGGSAGSLRRSASEQYRAALADYVQRVDDAACHPALVLTAELLGLAAEHLEERKRELGALDYDDLALLARDLFRAEPGVAAAYAARLQRVMVDEFQDTNRLQIDLIQALGQPQVFAVGDALQSIYGFRNADVEVFLDEERRREPLGEVERLAENYRSEPEILALVNAAFGPHQRHWRALLPGRQAEAEPPRVELLLTDASRWTAEPDDGGPSADELERLAAGLPAAGPHIVAEARLVAERVAALTAAGRSAKDIVVLLRAGANLALYERALEQAGVPAVASQGRGWWARLEVQDLLSHLRVLANPRDEEALLGALSAFAGASANTLALLAARREQGRGLWETLERATGGAPDGALAELTPEENERLRAYHALLRGEREAAGRLGPGDLLRRVLDATGYEALAAARPGGARRVANVRKLVLLADGCVARGEHDVRTFTDFAAAELAADAPTSDAPVDVGESAAVRLMTIHAAKGLQFPIVVLADLGRTPPAGRPRILVDERDGRVGLSVLTADRVRRKGFDHDALGEQRAVRECEEGRRVVHVGVTRAQELLILSGAAKLAGDELPAASRGSAPLAWMCRGLLGHELGDLREADDEVVAVADESGQWRASLRVRVNRPRAVGRVLQRLAPDGEEAPVQPPAPDPVIAGALVEAAGPAFAGELSYSSLSDYARCPYSWYLRRVLHLPERDGADVAGASGGAFGPEARDRGSLAHALLEHADLRHGAPGPTPDSVREQAGVLGIAVSEADVDDQLRLVEAFLRSPLRERAGCARRVLREARFAVPLDAGRPHHQLLTGSIDLLVEEDDGTWLIVDYKSDHVPAARDLEAHVRERYALQRAVYALAALRAGAGVAEVAHLFLERPDRPAIARFGPAQDGELEEALRGAAAGILAGAYPVTASPHASLCATCPGRGGLCSWPDAMTRCPGPAAAD